MRQMKKRSNNSETIEELNEAIDSLNLDYTRLTDRFQEITQTVRRVEQKTDRLSQTVNDAIAHSGSTLETQTWDPLVSLYFFVFCFV